MRPYSPLLILLAGPGLTGCDAVRTPWTEKPVECIAPVTPEGAPGPAPPTAPVTLPYCETEVSPTETTEPAQTQSGPDDPGPETSSDATSDTETSQTTSPETSQQDETAPGTEPETSDPAAADTDTAITDQTDTETPETETSETETPETETSETAPLPVKFDYYPPGELIPGTGTGQRDEMIYVPDMVFPIRSAPAFPQSMVYRPGGGGVGGDQCDTSNYSLPWQDNFCERRSRTRNTPFCPADKVHQGQDIRVGTASDCETLRQTPAAERALHEAVAVEDGIIQYIGRYSVQLKGTQTGNLYSYLHLNMARLDVTALQSVSAGERIGYVSNDFGGTPTTFHLHFEIKAAVEGLGFVHIPPYTSLIAAYERREAGRGQRVENDQVAIASSQALAFRDGDFIE